MKFQGRINKYKDYSAPINTVVGVYKIFLEEKKIDFNSDDEIFLLNDANVNNLYDLIKEIITTVSLSQQSKMGVTFFVLNNCLKELLGFDFYKIYIFLELNKNELFTFDNFILIRNHPEFFTSIGTLSNAELTKKNFSALLSQIESGIIDPSAFNTELDFEVTHEGSAKPE